jgi:hypothetical protein
MSGVRVIAGSKRASNPLLEDRIASLTLAMTVDMRAS